MDIHYFVRKFIIKELDMVDYIHYDAVIYRDTAELEWAYVEDRPCENVESEYKCIHPNCNYFIGDDQMDVFMHIEREHPSVEGLRVECNENST